MDTEEFMNSIVSKEFYDINKKYFDDIFSHIEKCDKFFSLETKRILANTLDKKKKDNSYKMDLRIKKTENGIKVPYAFDNLFSFIKPHIPKSITSIKLPLSKINIKDLRDFKDLDTLITDEYIDISDLKKIKRYTNIKTIYGHFYFSYFCGDKGVSYNENRFLYKDIEVIDKSKRIKNNDSLLIIRPSTKSLKEVKEIIEKFDIKKTSRINVINDEVNIDIVLDKNRAIMKIVCKDYNYIYKYYNMLKKLNINLEEIVISAVFKDKKINYDDIDYEKLDKLSEKVNLLVTFDGSYFSRASYEDYRALVEAIKYYKDLINTYSLSPLEKLTFAYDIMKSFVYKEVDNNKLEDSREAHRVIQTNNIVCVGYVSLLNEILFELDNNIISGTLDVICYEDNEDEEDEEEGHVRNIVRINDDKYDIHGFYLLDSTWDSYNEDYYEKYGEDYDALSLYKFFLIPITQYSEVFDNEKMINLFDGKLEILRESYINEEVIDDCISILEEADSDYNYSFKTIIYSKDFNKTFCNENNNDRALLKEFKSRRISLDEFLTLIRNVRVCEGYYGELLDKEIEKIERINSEFFEDSVEYKLKKR